jgi:heme exporter protein A
MDGAAFIEVSGIKKSFGQKKVLDGVDLSLGRGEAALLLGPNGAGKSTLCRILALLSRPSSGDLLFKGEKVVDQTRKRYKEILGYLSHQILLYNHLSADENLQFFASLYGVENSKQKIDGLLEQFGLTRYRNQLVGNFSRGMQQRMSLAKLLLPGPELLLLDEPFTGLDPEGAGRLVESLKALKSENRAILLITHELDESVEIAETMFVLDKGRIAYKGELPPLNRLKDLYFEITGGQKQ